MPRTLTELYDLNKSRPDDLSGEELARLEEAMGRVQTGNARDDDDRALADHIWEQLLREQQAQETARRAERESRDRFAADRYREFLDANRGDRRVLTNLTVERGRLTGKQAAEFLVQKYRNVAPGDEEWNAIMIDLSIYASTQGSAVRGSGYALEQRRFQELCSRSSAYLSRLLEQQADFKNNITDEQVAAAAEIDNYLLELRNGTLDPLRPNGIGKPQTPALLRSGNHQTIGLNPGEELRPENETRGMPLFSHEPSPNDLRQGVLGNCYLMAALSGLAERYPEKLRSCLTDNDNGTVTVRFFRKDISEETGKCTGYTPVLVTVDKRVPKTTAARDCLWAEMIERAYVASGMADAKGLTGGPAPLPSEQQAVLSGKFDPLDYPWLHDGLEKKPWRPAYAQIEGGVSSSFLELLLGPEAEAALIDFDKFPDNDRVAQVRLALETALRQGSLVNAATYNHDRAHPDVPLTDRRENKGVYYNHAYTVLGIGEKTVDGITATFVTLRNPHAMTGRVYHAENGRLVGEQDEAEGGVFDLTLEDFANEYERMMVNHLERVRESDPQPADDLLKPEYLSHEGMKRWNKELLRGLEFDKLLYTSDDFQKLAKTARTLAVNLAGMTGYPMDDVKQRSIIGKLRREAEAYLAANPDILVPSDVECTEKARSLITVCDALTQGLCAPAALYADRFAEKVLRARAAADLRSADPAVQAQGRATQQALANGDRSEVERMLKQDPAIRSFADVLRPSQAEACVRQRDESCLSLYQDLWEIPMLHFRREDRVLSEYCKALGEFSRALNDTDKRIGGKPSPEYEAMKEKLARVREVFPLAMQGKGISAGTAMTQMKELMAACDTYIDHCTAHPRTDSRRAERLAQAQNLRTLYAGMKLGARDPKEYICGLMADAVVRDSAKTAGVALPTAERIAQAKALQNGPELAAIRRKLSLNALGKLSRKSPAEIRKAILDARAKLPKAARSPENRPAPARDIAPRVL